MRENRRRNDELNIKSYSFDNHVVTVEVEKSGEGYSSEWWISSYNDGKYYIVATTSLPVYGDSIEEAQQVAYFIFEDVVEFLLKASGGRGVIHTKPERDKRMPIAELHIQEHRKQFNVVPLKKYQTVAEYELTQEFGVHIAAVLLAELDGLPISTIKRRIASVYYGA